MSEHRALRRAPRPRSARVADPDTSSVLLAAVVVSIGAVALGWLVAPSATTSTVPSQLLALLRVTLTSVLGATLLLGPGLLLRGRMPSGRAALPLGLVPLPGLLVTAALGAVVWAGAAQGYGTAAARGGVLIVLAVMGVGARVSPAPLTRQEGRVLTVSAVAFSMALGRAMWSFGPEGELYAGTISRTLEVGDRPDSRISYHVVSLVANGLRPNSPAGAALFAPYSFSDRGPLPGLFATPLMLASGTNPVPGFPDQPWMLFDPQGFMAYRVVMMLLAVTALLATYSVARRACGEHVAWLSVLVVAGTPFVVHETYFTWPKLAAAAQCLMAAYFVLGRRYVSAGVLAGIGFLLHPLALLSVPTLALLALMVEWRGHGGWRWGVRSSVTGLRMGAGMGAVVGAWVLVNGPHYSQGGFLRYLVMADNTSPVGWSTWLASRTRSFFNTVIPLRVPLREADNPSINSVFAPSDGVVHFFFQYWVGLPFGGAILFYPFLLFGLVVMLRKRPVVVLGVVVLPLLLFAVYWGSFASGLMREGLHTWLLTVLIVWSAQFNDRLGVGVPLPSVLRLVLTLRPVETVVMIAVPSVHCALSRDPMPMLTTGDLGALILVLGSAACLVWLTAEGTRPVSPGSRSSRPLPTARRSRRTAG